MEDSRKRKLQEPSKLLMLWQSFKMFVGCSNLNSANLLMISSSRLFSLFSYICSFSQSLWDMVALAGLGRPMRKMENFAGICDASIQMRSSAKMDETRMVGTSKLHLYVFNTWLKWVRALEREDRLRRFFNSLLGVVEGGE